MALTTAGINTVIVGNAIGNSSRNVGVLCAATTINKWSKYKPFIYNTTGLNMAEFLTALAANNYGLNVTQIPLSNLAETAVGDWHYNRPGGGSASGYRLGDFRGYEHQSQPPFFMIGYPTSTFLAEGGIKVFSWDRNQSIDNPIMGILPSEILSGNWYFGIALFWTVGTTAYKAFITTSTTIAASTKDDLTIDFSQSPFTNVADGDTPFTWVAFVSDTAFSTMQTDFNQVANVVVFPHKEYAVEQPANFVEKGTFNVQIPYLYVSPLSFTFDTTYYTANGDTKDFGITSFPDATTWNFAFNPSIIGLSAAKVGDNILRVTFPTGLFSTQTTNLVISYTGVGTVASKTIALTIEPV